MARDRQHVSASLAIRRDRAGRNNSHTPVASGASPTNPKQAGIKARAPRRSAHEAPHLERHGEPEERKEDEEGADDDPEAAPRRTGPPGSAQPDDALIGVQFALDAVGQRRGQVRQRPVRQGLSEALMVVLARGARPVTASPPAPAAPFFSSSIFSALTPVAPTRRSSFSDFQSLQRVRALSVMAARPRSSTWSFGSARQTPAVLSLTEVESGRALASSSGSPATAGISRATCRSAS